MRLSFIMAYIKIIDILGDMPAPEHLVACTSGCTIANLPCIMATPFLRRYVSTGHRGGVILQIGFETNMGKRNRTSVLSFGDFAIATIYSHMITKMYPNWNSGK